MTRAIRLLFVLFVAVIAPAQDAWVQPALGETAFHQALLDLGTDLRLMCVAAHPDDEDSSTLTLYRKKWGYTTIALIATRGEGGQNEIGPELYNELGVIRTHEMRRASEITGAELHFLDLAEFGYSKSDEETYEIWGRDEPLRRMVRKIRETRPDVIISNHGPGGGHGHHQVVGQTLLEAFDAAADPKVFPEQIKEGLEPWQVARFYVRGGGGSDSVTSDTSEFDPVLGVTYAEIAGKAHSEHLSQGMDYLIGIFSRGRQSNYTLRKEAPGGVSGGGKVPAPGGGLFAGLMDRVPPKAREVSESKLTLEEAKKAALGLLASGDDVVRADANNVAAIAMQLRLRAQVSDAEVVPGQALTIEAGLSDYGDRDAQAATFTLEPKPWTQIAAAAAEEAALNEGGQAAASLTVTIPDGAAATIPHPEKLFEPHFLEPQFEVVARVEISGAGLELRAPVYVDVAPRVSLKFLRAPYLVKLGETETRFDLMVTNHSPEAAAAEISFAPPRGFEVANGEHSVSLAKEGDQVVLPLRAKIAPALSAGDYELTARLAGSDVETGGLIRVVDVVVPEDIRVGVVQSYDDTFMTTLERLGVPHEALTVDEFSPEKLDSFTTIIVDIRAYLYVPGLVANNQALFDYVKRGGTLVVNYHKTIEWEPHYAPYPITLSRNRVTVEDAPITVLMPEHPLFNAPNKITAGDWDGWIQERGLYFPSDWAAEYTPLIETQDPGENNPPGSVLIAEYGEGTYLYTALGWYRQLRELHPGTLRIFANMLAL